MTTAVQMWRANDGAMFNTEAEAIERDAIIAQVKSAMLPLGKSHGACRFTGNGFIQHSRLAVTAAKVALLEITRPLLAKWFAEREAKNPNIDWLEVHGGWFGRLLDGSCDPVERAWGRMCRIDGKCREWDQQFFAANPDDGEQICLAQGPVQ